MTRRAFDASTDTNNDRGFKVCAFSPRAFHRPHYTIDLEDTAPTLPSYTMPPAFHTAREEDAFMKELLSGLDSSMFNAPPSPDVPRTRATKPLSSSSESNSARLSTNKSILTTPTKPKQGYTNTKVAASRAVNETKTKAPILTVKSESVVRGDCGQDENHDAARQREDLDQLLAGAEDWDWDDMNSDFLTPKKSPSKAGRPAMPGSSASLLPALVLNTEAKQSDVEEAQYHKEPCTRCVVKSVQDVVVEGEDRKELLVKVGSGNEERLVILRDDWTYTDVRQGDIVNVLGTFHLPPSTSTSIPRRTIEITSKENLLILHPDILITATALANAPACHRKPLLQTLVRSSTEITPALVWGNILHEVMQTCMKAERWDERFVDGKISEVVRANLDSLLKIDVKVEQAVREIKMRAGGLRSFAEKYIAKRPKENAVLTNTRAVDGQTSLLAISGLLDIEEDIWSPTYGLKGKLDASVDALVDEVELRATDNPFTIAKGQSSSTRKITKHKFPFEIKTGRAVAGMEHRAQTMLYTLLMSERYEEDVQSGLLYYTQSEEVVRVPAARNEIRGLMVARNEMAEYMMRRMGDTPNPARKTNEKSGTKAEKDEDALDTCMLYRRAVERVVDETSPIRDIYDLKTGHLTAPQAEFFRTWEALLSMEEQEVVRFRKELWTLQAAEREKKGRCFAEMVLDSTWSPSESLAQRQEGKIHRYTFRFVRRGDAVGGESLLNGHMSQGDAITVSVEPDLIALGRGFILELAPDAVVVGVDHDLSGESISVRRHRQSGDSTTAEKMAAIYRIDKDELFGGMARIRDNLAQLFYPEGDTRSLELIVDLKAPVFDQLEGPLVPEHEPVADVIRQLNANQQEAIRRVLRARDYALILGMPGTGKTTVVAAIIKALVCMGKTVLLTSHTHSAVDTILLKLKDKADFGILRLGNMDKIHPKIHDLTLSARRTATTVEQLEQQVMTPPVIATTCLSIDHPLFLRRKFDYCIVDEASQITLPTCLGPLRYADKFVLVGDHFQLPPLVRNRGARKGGLDVSLFRRLSEAHPHAVVDLTDQYRMNEDIMLLSNKLIYSDRLRCGTPEVAKRTLVIPDPGYLQTLHLGSSCSSPCWIEQLMDERCKAVFVDTDAVPAEESRVGDLVQNVTEAAMVQQLTRCLLRSGIHEEQIGVISLYRQQIKLLSYLLQDHKSIEILTADRSQGRDKDCIIISMVRSNEYGTIGDLLKDWRRINVSFTRARSKLVIFGSRSTLKTAPLLREFFQLMENRNWTLTLPANAHQIHDALVCDNPRKRLADDPVDTDVPDTTEAECPRHQKRAKKVDVTEEGLSRGRYIMKDLLNGGM
ncbi:hypothetical protein NM688_g3640 [Phlebia brevispora]|uniref:Uncharacterized protein n=1 Tax=Phlebia brevispora TaxID=194682 RepID=A0ACC1T563_9APHY|nr:hypothetical protein NM688_g3640 [Phlebia brevispora]